MNLREKVANELRYNGYSSLNAILALFERSAVEEKRKAFVACYEWLVDKVDRDRTACPRDAEVESIRRYPLPKEDKT